MSRNSSVEKVPWLSFVRSFVESNSDFDDGMFRNWVQILEREQRQKKSSRIILTRKINHQMKQGMNPHYKTGKSKTPKLKPLIVMPRWLDKRL
jgi:hypothetical protein